MIWRVRGHATFRELARAPVRRQGALSARFLRGDPSAPPRVAFAIPRAVGGAVARNRLRRRLRAALHELSTELVPGGAYLFGAGRAAMSATPRELHDTLRALLGAVRAESGGVR